MRLACGISDAEDIPFVAGADARPDWTRGKPRTVEVSPIQSIAHAPARSREVTEDRVRCRHMTILFGAITPGTMVPAQPREHVAPYPARDRQPAMIGQNHAAIAAGKGEQRHRSGASNEAREMRLEAEQVRRAGSALLNLAW